MTCRREPPPRVVTRRYPAAPEVGDTVLHDGRPAVVTVVYPGRRLHGTQLDCAPRCDCKGILPRVVRRAYHVRDSQWYEHTGGY